MTYIEAGTFFIQNGEDGPVLSLRCPCNQNLLRIRAGGWIRCKKCGRTHTAPTDHTGLPIVNSKRMLEYFEAYDALPRDRTR
jgi:hypothetical protein